MLRYYIFLVSRNRYGQHFFPVTTEILYLWSGSQCHAVRWSTRPCPWLHMSKTQPNPAGVAVLLLLIHLETLPLLLQRCLQSLIPMVFQSLLIYWMCYLSRLHLFFDRQGLGLYIWDAWSARWATQHPQIAHNLTARPWVPSNTPARCRRGPIQHWFNVSLFLLAILQEDSWARDILFTTAEHFDTDIIQRFLTL